MNLVVWRAVKSTKIVAIGDGHHGAETGDFVQDIVAEAIEIYLKGDVLTGKHVVGYLRKGQAI